MHRLTASQWVLLIGAAVCLFKMVGAYQAMKQLRVPGIPWNRRLWRGWWRKLEFYTDQGKAAEFLAAYDRWLVGLFVVLAIAFFAR